MRLRLISLCLVVAALVAFGLLALRSNISSAPDYPTRLISTSDAEITIEIPTGSTGSEIAQLLFTNGVVKSSLAYFRIAVGDKESEKTSPGAHRLTLSISASQALEQLLDPSRIPNLIKVFEGAWKSEIVASMRQYGFNTSEINLAFRDVSLPSGFNSAEGLLFPAQYSFPKGTTATQVVQSMINRFRVEKAGIDILTVKSPYSPLQLITIASIVQAEGDLADFSKVARTILNRLKISMPLQMDSTVHYIKKARGEIFLSTNSTLINSPYNTYKHYGLPPTPIGNPGADALRAVLHPSQGDWLYFITVAPGDTRFTASGEEFINWKRMYEKNRKAGVFK